ncbi:MAG: 5-oxoprolinase subunit PxpB [Synergistaceae bacterium]|nr:5-oxoprolinase subunit PxpB [Synergistota bacterium]NLM71573.1 5-oxoprolinase subunit PxpB [Synergistaceae bacterium]
MTDREYPRLLGAGDGCVVVEYGDSIDMEVNTRVAALAASVREAEPPGFLDAVPTYRSLAVYFDPVVADVDALYRNLERMMTSSGAGEGGAKRKVVVVPTLYGGEHGPDLGNVAEHTGLPEEEVVRRHAANDCYCYMLGFTPGFAYLGGMDQSLETPRLKNPRELIPAGSVGIAGKQTGIYSIASPGGWQLIGRTPMMMFDPGRDPAIFLDAGMWVRFRPADRAEFDEIEAATASRSYQPEILEEEASS